MTLAFEILLGVGVKGEEGSPGSPSSRDIAVIGNRRNRAESQQNRAESGFPAEIKSGAWDSERYMDPSLPLRDSRENRFPCDSERSQGFPDSGDDGDVVR